MHYITSMLVPFFLHHTLLASRCYCW